MNKNQERIPILLDTDIGSDIDDALCLSYLLKQPRCELLGITTVTGQPIKRALLASTLCKAVGKEIPIYSGAEIPIQGEQKQKEVPQVEILGRFPRYHRFEDFKPESALNFLRETIYSQSDQITLLTIGPFTNIGLLFETDPEIPKLLKGLVSMSGVFSQEMKEIRALETNASLDPKATSIVYQTPLNQHTLISLDLTARSQISVKECQEKLTGRNLKPLLEMIEIWSKDHQTIIFHDPLAAVSIFKPELFRYQLGGAEVDEIGITSWDPQSKRLHRRAVEVDLNGFFNHYFEVVNQ